MSRMKWWGWGDPAKRLELSERGLAMLRERYARGEIGREECEAKIWELM